MAPSTSARTSPRTTSVYEPRRLSLVASLSGPSSVPFRSGSGSGSGFGPGTLPVGPRFVFPRRDRAESRRPVSKRDACTSAANTRVASEARSFVLARDRATVSFTSRRRRSQRKIMVSATPRIGASAAAGGRVARRIRPRFHSAAIVTFLDFFRV